ncbi:unnamed protein product [Candidatus Paraburkholderia kirkii UZHbot1]|uniref:WGS project CAFE00000000 data, contig bkir_c43 n=1 Tax=Candidatus Paraburkholderia kirkii UZHbot1 TaxID=1055526 RepID=U3UAZ1_9BURK|nr:unnamed protein product [Candidatus Paraburkholderia kirkii UZHbot1]
MKTFSFTCVENLAALPSFHDAELVSIEHDPDVKSLILRFKRVSGPVETLMFSGVVAQRMIDFTDQNVASRLLISPMHRFSLDEFYAWVRWMYSRDDAKAPELDRTIIERLYRDVADGSKALFILEPSCGAEMAVLCESVSMLI